MYSFRSSLLLPAIVLAVSGCTMNTKPETGQDPTGTAWEFERVADQALPDRVRVSMAFEPEEGRVFGHAGCNRYTASYTLDNGTLTIGAAAATKMACPEALMAVEDRFLSMLGSALTVSIDPDSGRLDLTAPDGSRSTAFPATEDAAGS